MFNFLMAQVSEAELELDDPTALVAFVALDAFDPLAMVLLKRSIFLILSMSPTFDELLLEPEPAIVELSADDEEPLRSSEPSQLHGHQHTSLQPDEIDEEFEATDELALMGIVSLELLEAWRSLADLGRLTIDDRNLD